MFLELTLILIGAFLASLGWHWGGVAEGRTSWMAIGLPGLVLAGITLFSAASDKRTLPEWALAATGAALAGVSAGVVRWGVVTDRTLGLFAFIFSASAGLSAGGISIAAHAYSILSLATTLAAVCSGLIFVVAILPRIPILRRVIGLLLVFGGLSVGFLGYAPSLNVTFGL